MARWGIHIATVTFLISIKVSVIHGKCNFPEYLRRTDPWAGDLKDGQMVAYIHSKYIRVRESYDGAPDPYTKDCLQLGPDGKFLIIQDKKYQCLQFLKRSDHIIQLKMSDLYDRHSMEICNEDKMAINPFPLVQLSQGRSKNFSCPFVGGFNIYVYYPHPNNSLVCGNNRLLMRVESECEQGGEIQIDFRNEKCVPEDLPRTPVQRAKCVAHWNHGIYTFVVLRHAEKPDQWWCMRTSDPLSDIREAYLWLQLVCDYTSVPNPEISLNYLKLKFVRLVFSSTCADEIQVCQGDQNYCDASFKQHCALTCGQCRSEHQIGLCTFDEQYRGEWVDSGVKDEFRITFGPYTVQGDNKRGSLGNYNCLNLESDVYPDKRVLLETYDNGCLPRYACAEMSKVNSSVMKFRLGDRHAWPLPNARSQKEYICKPDNFKEPHRAESRLIRERAARLLIRTQETKEVPCNISSHLQNGVSFTEDGRRCGGCLYYDPSANSSRFIIRPVNCNEGTTSDSKADHKTDSGVPISYSCLATFGFHKNTHSVITKTTSGHQYLMWTFSGTKDITVMKASEAFVYGQNRNIKSEYVEVKFSILQQDTFKCHMNPLYPTTSTVYYIDHKPRTTPGPIKETNHKDGKYTFYPETPYKPDKNTANAVDPGRSKVTPHPSKSGNLRGVNGRGASSVYHSNESFYVTILMTSLAVWRATFSSVGALSVT